MLENVEIEFIKQGHLLQLAPEIEDIYKLTKIAILWSIDVRRTTLYIEPRLDLHKLSSLVKVS